MKHAWLTARPIAHRGLHNAAAGVIENTASAFRAAIDGNYGIETDVQISADGEAMVHHDDALGRLTEGHTALANMAASDIRSAKFKATGDRILTLSELLDLVAGRVPIVIELKSHFDGDTRLAARVAEVLATYRGSAAVMSFDPALVERIRAIAPELDPRYRRRAALHPSRMGPALPRREIPACFSFARAEHPAAFHRLFGTRPAGAGPARGTQSRPATPDLDDPQRGRAGPRPALCRSGHL